MRCKGVSQEDEEMLKSLNDAVDLACKARKKWLDDNMAKYSDLQIGDDVYDIQKGIKVGTVTAICRWHSDDIRFDNSLSSYVEFEEFSLFDSGNKCRVIGNTSSKHGLGTKQHALMVAKHRRDSLA